MKRDNSKTNYTGLTILFGLLTAFYTMVALDKCEQEITSNANDKHNIIEEIEGQHGYIPTYEVQIK
jgi:hypothetical protein